jgi:hypothetical protein
MRKDRTKEYYLNQINEHWLTRWIYRLKICRFFKDGDCVSATHNWWNPLSWIVAPVIFIIAGCLEGFPYAWEYKHEIGIGLSSYWENHKGEIEWL